MWGPSESKSATRRDGLGLRKQFVDRGFALAIVHVAHVEAQVNGARNHVASVGPHFQFANGCYKAFGATGKRLDLRNPFRGSDEGIVA